MPAEPVKNPMSGYCPMAGKYFYPPLDSIWIGMCPKSVAAVQSSNGDYYNIPDTIRCVHVDPSMVYIEIIRIILPRSSH